MPDSYEYIAVSHHQGVLVLTLQIATVREYEVSQAMERELIRAAESDPSKDVIVDFGQTEYMSSVGYLPFVGLRGSVDKRGGRVVLYNQSANIKEMFEATRLLVNPRSPKAPFHCAETLTEALALLTSCEPGQPSHAQRFAGDDNQQQIPINEEPVAQASPPSANPVSTEGFISTTIVDEDILVVYLHGKLDSATTKEFEEVVQKHFDEGRSKIIIDCAGLGYISSLGIGSVVALQSRLRKRGGAVKLAALFGMAAEILRAVRIDKMLDIYGDTEFARQSFYQ
jgi:anti-sigma B factor antagonist